MTTSKLISDDYLDDTDPNNFARVELAVGIPVTSTLTPVVSNWTRISDNPEGYAASYLGAAHALLGRGVDTQLCSIIVLKKGPGENSHKTIKAAALLGGFVLIAHTIKPITDANRPYINNEDRHGSLYDTA